MEANLKQETAAHALLCREQMCETYKSLRSEQKELEAKTFKYVVTTPFMALGLVQFMSVTDIIQAYGVISEYGTVRDRAIQDLGLTPKDCGKEGEQYLNIPIETWKNELRTRVDEIHTQNRLNEISEALPIVTKHLSADDIFQLDMENLSKIL